ncbi:MAG: response regulator transcription factor [Dehalococcoidales bacterium]
MDKVRVLVADKNALIRDGICALMRTYKSIEVTGVATSCREIIEMVRGKPPDVVLMDIAMPLMDAATVIRQIRKENSGIKVLLVSEHEDRDCILRGLKAGGNGYIPRRATASDLVSGILAVYRGGYFLYPSVAKTMVGEYLRIKRGLSPDPYDQLSDRERYVLQLIAEGHKSQQIAEVLHIALKTVLRHRANIMTKLGTHNQTELIKYAIRKHLIEL